MIQLIYENKLKINIADLSICISAECDRNIRIDNLKLVWI